MPEAPYTLVDALPEDYSKGLAQKAVEAALYARSPEEQDRNHSANWNNAKRIHPSQDAVLWSTVWTVSGIGIFVGLAAAWWLA